VRCASQTADSAQEGGHDGRDRAHHSEVTEVKAAPGYVLVRCHSPPVNLNGLNSDAIDAHAEGDTKKSGLTGRLQNLKVSIEHSGEITTL
jgi:hypothetical protein